MFGYLKPDKTKLSKGEIGLYQTFLCGICMSTKQRFGNTKRMLANFDINFFNILLHSYNDLPLNHYPARCVASPVKKRSIMTTDDITAKLSAANILLAYHKVCDDENDEGKLKAKLAKKILKKAYEKAKAQEFGLDEIMLRQNKQLYLLEKENCKSIDKLSHCFAQLSREMIAYLQPDANDFLLDLAYNIGKWVYIADAIDDIKKDYKNKQFNAFLSMYGSIEETIKNIDEVRFVFNTTLNKATSDYNDLNLQYFNCILNNIMYTSLRSITDKLLSNIVADKEKM